MNTQISELNGVTNSSSVWGDFVDSDGECDVEDACEPINRYEKGLYLPICIGEVVAGRYRIEHKLGHGGMVHRDLNSANVMFGLSSFETGADLTTKYQILGRPQKMELLTDQEMWKDGQLVAPMTPKDRFVVQDTITLGDFGLAIRSGTEVVFKLQVPVGYCAPERMHQINPTRASDMWSYMCIFAELYLKWPLFGPSFFGGGFCFVAELFVRVLGPLPLSWKGSYDGDGEPDESWYDQS